MADDEILVQLDRRLAEVEARLGRHTEVWEGIRLDMRQREERWIRIYRDEAEATRSSHERVSAAQEKLWAEVRDLREESRAQRQALLALIDRLPPPGTSG